MRYNSIQESSSQESHAEQMIAMLETGTVVAAGDGKARVRLQPTASCDVCGCKGACSGSEGKPFVVDADNMCDAKPGDEVAVEMAPVPMWLSILFVFVGPLVLMLAGLGVGHWAGGDDSAAALGAAGGLAMGFVVLAAANKMLAAKAEYRPTIVRVDAEASELEHES